MNTFYELVEVAEIRSKTWWLLSRFYLERPETAYLRELSEAIQPAESDANGIADKPLRLLARLLDSESLEALSNRLMPEYTRLFRGIREGYGPPPPYESLYRGDEFMGDLAADVQRFYTAGGFYKIVPEVGAADHLGAELRFLSLSCFNEMEAWRNNDATGAVQHLEAQLGFLDQHLLAWFPVYAQRILRETREPFYRAAVQLTQDFLEQDRLCLEQLHSHLEAA